jgi:hypothetical protein
MALFTRNKKRDDELGDEFDDLNDAPEADNFNPPDEYDETIGIDHLNEANDEFDEPEERPKKSKRKSRGRKSKSDDESDALDPDADPVEEEPEGINWGSPVKPSLSLPSKAIIEAVDRDAAQHKMKRLFVIAIAGLMAFGITAGGLSIYSAGQLEGARSEGRALEEAVSQLQPIADYSKAFQDRKDAVTKVLAKGIDYTSIQNSVFEVANQNGVLIKSENSTPTSPCMAPSPFVAPTGLGCFTLQVSAADTASLSAFAAGLTTKTGIPDAYITAITTGTDGKAEGTLSFNYDNKLVSPRYIAFAKDDASGTPATAPPATTPETTQGGN